MGNRQFVYRLLAGLLLGMVLFGAAACANRAQGDQVKPDVKVVPELFDAWTDPMVLPPPGNAYIHLGSRVVRMDELNVCGVRENGSAFLFRGTGRDTDGRLFTMRVYRRLAGDRAQAPAVEERIQFSIRDEAGIWANSSMRIAQDEPGDEIRTIHGHAETVPAVRVRSDGRGAWAVGHIAPEQAGNGLAGTGPVVAVVHCGQ